MLRTIALMMFYQQEFLFCSATNLYKTKNPNICWGFEEVPSGFEPL